MSRSLTQEQKILECALIVVCLGLTAMFYSMQGYKLVVLNLFFLPVVLSGFYLGRYHAGVMAIFCVFSASIVAMLDVSALVASTSASVVILAVTVWSAVLGLTAMLVGTLSDERERKSGDLHEAYIGVVEVLSQYLQSAHPHLKARAISVAELSQKVASEMRLSSRQIDDIRVAALLFDMQHVEISARVIRRAVGSLESDSTVITPHTFRGRDLVLSLGSVLSGAIPLLLDKDEMLLAEDGDSAPSQREMPLGAQIIRLVRDYYAMVSGELGGPKVLPQDALDELRATKSSGYEPQILEALDDCISKSPPSEEPVLEAVT